MKTFYTLLIKTIVQNQQKGKELINIAQNNKEYSIQNFSMWLIRNIRFTIKIVKL